MQRLPSAIRGWEAYPDSLMVCHNRSLCFRDALSSLASVRLRFMKLPLALFTALVVLSVKADQLACAQDVANQSRSFRFTYQVEIKGLSSGDKVRGWIPEPIQDRYQSTELVARSLPGVHRVSHERRYGNQTSYFETTTKSPDSLHASLSWDIIRTLADPLSESEPTPGLTAQTQRLFLRGNKYVPVGGATAETLLQERPPTDALQRGEFLFDLVADHMTYDKSRPGYGNGDAVWACNSQFGNCTDFHSLFISLARGLSLPARFENKPLQSLQLGYAAVTASPLPQ